MVKHACACARPALAAVAVAGAAALAAAPWPVLAQDAPPPTPLAPHAQITAWLQALHEAELKTFYLACSRAATRRMLGFGEAAVCSLGYETLLKRSFGGNFGALLAWERAQPVDRGAAQD